MKRTMFLAATVFAVAVGFAAAAGAATLSVVSDKAQYGIGDTITLTVTGDRQGANAYSIFGKLNYDGALVDNGTRTQTALPNSVYGAWNKGGLLANDTGDNTDTYSFAFSQISAYGTDGAVPTPLSTVTLIAKAAGVVNVVFDDNNVAPALRLSFFGLTSAPGTSFEITVVPEPTTAALLGLGLVGLVLSGRRRS